MAENQQNQQSAAAPPLPYFDFSTYLKERYGGPVVRIPVDIGFGCPHRQGEDGRGAGGCDFCGDDGSRAAYLGDRKTVAEQVQAGLTLAEKRQAGEKYFLMAYLQAYTSTHDPLKQLRQKIAEVLAQAEFKIITLSTRPDCLSDEVLDYLTELQEFYDVWVELGIQTANDKTLAAVNRGHDFESSRQAVLQLNSLNIPVAAHVILGLPGETAEEVRHTAEELAKLPLSGIKIHNLLVLKGTVLEKRFLAGEFQALDEHEYGELLMDFLRRIPASWPVMRISADAVPQVLVAPRWWMQKGQFLEYVVRQMQERGWRQGDLIVKENIRDITTAAIPMLAKDPQIGLPQQLVAMEDLAELAKLLHYNEWLEFGSQTISCMALPCGYGLGLLIMGAALPPGVSNRIRIVGVGGDPLRFLELRRQYGGEALHTLMEEKRATFPWGSVEVHWGDPRHLIMVSRHRTDFVWVEPDSIEDCPEIFTLEFWRHVVHHVHRDTMIISPCTDAPFRKVLMKTGFTVGECHGHFVGGKGTIASLNASLVPKRLNFFQRQILNLTTSGVPLRDPAFVWSSKKILQHRQAAVARLAKWGKKRRL
jgi:radical SAM protein (TIGR01212 family)